MSSPCEPISAFDAEALRLRPRLCSAVEGLRGLNMRRGDIAASICPRWRIERQIGRDRATWGRFVLSPKAGGEQGWNWSTVISTGTARAGALPLAFSPIRAEAARWGGLASHSIRQRQYMNC